MLWFQYQMKECSLPWYTHNTTPPYPENIYFCTTFALWYYRGGKAALVNGDCLYMEGERRPDTMSVLSEGSWTGLTTCGRPLNWFDHMGGFTTLSVLGEGSWTGLTTCGRENEASSFFFYIQNDGSVKMINIGSITREGGCRLCAFEFKVMV